MSDKEAEQQLKPERRVRRKVVKIVIEYEDETTETYRPVNAWIRISPNQQDIGRNVHLHYHDFDVHWTESRELPRVKMTVEENKNSVITGQ